MERIIGVDPGTKITGYGIIDIHGNQTTHVDCGGIHAPPKAPIEERLLYIYRHFHEILREFRPAFAGVEDVFVAKNAKSSLLLGHVRGILLLALAEHDIPHIAYPPREVKKTITGVGTASKEQIQYMVKQLLGLQEIAFEDASDALAIAICHSQRLKFQKQLIKS